MCFFRKVNQIYLKGQYGSIWIVPDSSFSEIKRKVLKEIYKEPLRGQYVLDSIIFWKLMKILWKDNMDQTILYFMIFVMYPILENRVNSKI